MQGQESKVLTIGWREFVALPEWGVSRIKAKVDTGARSSAIDVAELCELDDERVRFDVIVRRRPAEKRVTIEAPVVRRTNIRSSFGKTRGRLIVSTTVAIGPVQKLVELGLVCREHMLCRMLLGRTALQNTFLVDPGRCFVFDHKAGTTDVGKLPRGSRS